MSELETCPFCGKSDKVTIYTESMVHHGELLWIHYGVKCKRCHFGIPTYAKKATAIRKWNTRPAEDALNRELTEQAANYENIICEYKRDVKQAVEQIDTMTVGIEQLKAEVTRYRRALHNLKEDCQRRLHWKSSSLEELFLHEAITHIDAELDFSPDTVKMEDEEIEQLKASLRDMCELWDSMGTQIPPLLNEQKYLNAKAIVGTDTNDPANAPDTGKMEEK